MNFSLTILCALAFQLGAISISGNALEPTQQQSVEPMQQVPNRVKVESCKKTLECYTCLLKEGFRTSHTNSWDIESLPYSHMYLKEKDTDSLFTGIAMREASTMIGNMKYLETIMKKIEETDCLEDIQLTLSGEEFSNFFQTTHMDLGDAIDRMKKRIQMLEKNPTRANAQSIVKDMSSTKYRDLYMKLTQCIATIDDYLEY